MQREDSLGLHGLRKLNESPFREEGNGEGTFKNSIPCKTGLEEVERHGLNPRLLLLEVLRLFQVDEEQG